MTAPLTERLLLACVAGCTCMTKTPEIECHSDMCHYRLFTEALAMITLLEERMQDAMWEAIGGGD